MLIEKLSKTSNSSRLMVGISTIVILAIGIYNWAVSPQTSYLQAAQQYEQIMGDSKKKAISIKIKIAADNKRQAKLTSELESIRSRFFTEDQSAQFFSSLKDSAQRNGASLLSFNYINNIISPNKKSPSNALLTVESRTARLKIKGDYQSIRNFMDMLENQSEDISILEMNLSSETSNKDNLLSCSIVLKIYIIEEMGN